MALTTPKPGTRPTTDRTKEAIFSHLDSWGVLDDARVLDLFAGTGALGIEALSRGARELVAVESAAPAAALIAKTLTALKHNRSWEPGMSARVVKARAEKYAAAASAIAPFGVIFIDPPYAFETEACNQLLADLAGRESGELTGEGAVQVGLIDELGGLQDALGKLYDLIDEEDGRKKPRRGRPPKAKPDKEPPAKGAAK